MNMNCNKCRIKARGLGKHEYAEITACQCCQEPLNGSGSRDLTVSDNQTLFGFCEECSDAIQLLWYFQETTNPDLDMWDDNQRESAGSLIEEVGGLDKAQELAEFSTKLKLDENYIITSPFDMYENLGALSSINAYLNEKYAAD